jgi:hypothetical protein
MVVPKMVKNGNNSLLGIHNQSWSILEIMPSKLTKPLNQELKPFFTNLGTRMRAEILKNSNALHILSTTKFHTLSNFY